MTLWTLLMLSTFAIITSVTVRQKLTLAIRINERGKLRSIAEAGVKKAITMIIPGEDEFIEYTSLGEYWFDTEAVFKKMPIGDGFCEISYVDRDIVSNKLITRFGFVDEERKININVEDDIILRQLLRDGLGFDKIEAQEIAAAIVDWRDEDSQLSIPLGSAEDREYRSGAFAYEAKDAPFQVFDELYLVKGVNKDVFDIIKNYVTIYGNGKINANTAPREVFYGLGLDKSIIDKIMTFRFGEDGVPGTADDGIFTNPSSIVPQLSQRTHLSPSELAKISIVADQKLKTHSQIFKIQCRAFLANQKIKMDVTCVADRKGKILFWREN